jgi:hypothetical protein
MTGGGKSRTLKLMALQEKARIAGTLADMREVVRQKDEAERMVERLREALARQGGAPGVRLATEIMAERAMAAQFLTETERHKLRQDGAGRADGRGADKAREAGASPPDAGGQGKGPVRSEVEEKLALRDAAMPARRR